MSSTAQGVMGLTALTDIHHQGFIPGRMSDHGEHGEEAPAPPLVHPEFKAEIIELCQRGTGPLGSETPRESKEQQ